LGALGRQVQAPRDPVSTVTWADLFERAAAHDIDEVAIRERLRERREEESES